MSEENLLENGHWKKLKEKGNTVNEAYFQEEFFFSVIAPFMKNAQ